VLGGGGGGGGADPLQSVSSRVLLGESL